MMPDDGEKAVERRKSYTLQPLSVRPVDFSLTSGTNIPAPPDSPPVSPIENVRLSGPLNSHPTNDTMPVPGAFPPTPEPEHENGPNHIATTLHSEESNRDESASYRSPTPNTTVNQTSPSRRPGAVRRLFSLTSLRQSFSSSRTSFSIPPSTSSYGEQTTMQQRPQSPGVTSSTASFIPPPSTHSSKQARLRKERSTNWFKRKSGFFTTNENGLLDVVSEDPRPDSKRAKRPDLPMLPEISTLSGGSLGEGSIGWDEGLFKR